MTSTWEIKEGRRGMGESFTLISGPVESDLEMHDRCPDDFFKKNKVEALGRYITRKGLYLATRDFDYKSGVSYSFKRFGALT